MKKILLFSLLAFVCQAFSQDIKCFILEPPEQTLIGIKKIAVLDFSGYYGRVVSDYLISALLENKRGITTIKGGLFSKDVEGKTHWNGAQTNIYTIVERSRLDQVLTEQNFSQTGIVDENQVAALGKVLGVDAIISGVVNPITQDTKTREEISVYRNDQWIKVMGDCITRNVSVDARLRIININTAQIIGTKESSFKVKDKQCGDDIAKLTSSDELIKICIQAIVYQDLVNYFAPKFIQKTYELIEIDIDEYEDLSDKAIESAESNNFDEAYKIYSAILKEDPYNDVALYNLGVLNEVLGNFKEAQDSYKSAMNIRQDKDYAAALKFCQKSVEFNNVLNSLGVIIQPYNFVVSDDQLKSTTAKKIKLSGDSSKRITLRETPDDNGKIVVKVPGGIELEFLEKSGSWTKVKTFDGKIGYVNEDDID